MEKTTNTFEQLSCWQGRSGRLYSLKQQPLSDLNMSEHHLYLLSKVSDTGETALWVGTSDGLIHDDESRRAFLKAVHQADNAYIYEMAKHETVPPTLVWDLEVAKLNPEQRAA